jgi:hypothetical protein
VTTPEAIADALKGAHVAVVRPGDVLIVGLTDGLFGEDLERFHTDLTANLPEGIKAVVIEGCTQLAVVRPDVPA